MSPRFEPGKRYEDFEVVAEGPTGGPCTLRVSEVLTFWPRLEHMFAVLQPGGMFCHSTVEGTTWFSRPKDPEKHRILAMSKEDARRRIEALRDQEYANRALGRASTDEERGWSHAEHTRRLDVPVRRYRRDAIRRMGEAGVHPRRAAEALYAAGEPTETERFVAEQNEGWD